MAKARDDSISERWGGAFDPYDPRDPDSYPPKGPRRDPPCDPLDPTCDQRSPKNPKSCTAQNLCQDPRSKTPKCIPCSDADAIVKGGPGVNVGGTSVSVGGTNVSFTVPDWLKTLLGSELGVELLAQARQDTLNQRFAAARQVQEYAQGINIRKYLRDLYGRDVMGVEFQPEQPNLAQFVQGDVVPPGGVVKDAEGNIIGGGEGVAGAQTGSNAFLLPGEGSYKRVDTGYDPGQRNTWGLLAAPARGIASDLDAQLEQIRRSIPQGGQRDAALAAARASAYGDIGSLRQNLVQSALGNLGAMSQSQIFQTPLAPMTGTGSDLLGSATSKYSTDKQYDLGLRQIAAGKDASSNAFWSSIFGTIGTLAGGLF